MNKIRCSRGFTLLEVLISLIVVSVISAGLSGLFSISLKNQKLAYITQIKNDNLEIARSFRKWSSNENKGFLPDPYINPSTKNNYSPVNKNISDEKNASLISYLSNGRISNESINSDGSTAENVKVYQKISSLTFNQPIEGVSDLSVILKYDMGIIYQTKCGMNEDCNHDLPGASELYSSSAWKINYPDIAPVEIGTLDIQQGKWENTWQNLNHIRDKVRDGIRYEQLSSAAGNLNNLFYVPEATGTDKGQLGCATYWFDLSSSDVLEHYGIGPKEVYGKTQWGGVIDYCPDFDPKNEGENTPPHNGALRINKSVTEGISPSNNSSDNIVIII